HGRARAAVGVVAVGVVAVGLVAVVGVRAGPAPGLASAVAGLCAVRLVAARRDRHRVESSRRDLLAAVRLLIAELESGARPAAALTAAADSSAEHEVVLRASARAA